MKAVLLFSGGLDSILAARVLENLGIHVIAVNFSTPFTGRTRGRSGKLPAENSARMLGVEYLEVPAGQEYLDMVADPEFGYGKNTNPCIDCKIFFIRKAGEMMGALGASFLATGEVLGQRPMSQNKPSLDVIASRSGFADLLLRPLSAKKLPPTLPEKRGWVDRERLYGLTGRNRSGQIELAREFGIETYPNASGGCLLTDREFSKKLDDLIEHRVLSCANVELLKSGRHFRIEPSFKLVVGRDEADNSRIESLAGEGMFVFSTLDVPGPVGLGIGELTEKTEMLSAGIVARYASSDNRKLRILISGAKDAVVEVEKTGAAEAEKFRI